MANATPENLRQALDDVKNMNDGTMKELMLDQIDRRVTELEGGDPTPQETLIIKAVRTRSKNLRPHPAQTNKFQIRQQSKKRVKPTVNVITYALSHQ
jgi:hypothetical protein